MLSPLSRFAARRLRRQPAKRLEIYLEYNPINTVSYGLNKTSKEVLRDKIGSPGRSRTCIYRFIPTTAFAATGQCLGSGLSLNLGAGRFRLHPSSLYTF